MESFNKNLNDEKYKQYLDLNYRVKKKKDIYINRLNLNKYNQLNYNFRNIKIGNKNENISKCNNEYINFQKKKLNILNKRRYEEITTNQVYSYSIYNKSTNIPYNIMNDVHNIYYEPLKYPAYRISEKLKLKENEKSEIENENKENENENKEIENENKENGYKENNENVYNINKFKDYINKCEKNNLLEETINIKNLSEINNKEINDEKKNIIFNEEIKKKKFNELSEDEFNEENKKKSDILKNIYLNEKEKNNIQIENKNKENIILKDNENNIIIKKEYIKLHEIEKDEKEKEDIFLNNEINLNRNNKNNINIYKETNENNKNNENDENNKDNKNIINKNGNENEIKDCISINTIKNTINPNSITNEIKFILHMTLLTLYKDQLKPSYKKIKQRLKCFNENFEIKYNFLNIYASLKNQYIVAKSKKNVYVILKETPKWFNGWINTKQAINIYPKKMWKHFFLYLLDICRKKQLYIFFWFSFLKRLNDKSFLFYVNKEHKNCFINNDFFGYNENTNFINKIYKYNLSNFDYSYFSKINEKYKKKTNEEFIKHYNLIWIEEKKKKQNVENINENKTKQNLDFIKNENMNESNYEKNNNDLNILKDKNNEWLFNSDIYELASLFKKKNFYFFKDYSIGKIMHIIQLCLYNGILYQENGYIKPASCCNNIVSFIFYFMNNNEINKENNLKYLYDIYNIKNIESSYVLNDINEIKSFGSCSSDSSSLYNSSYTNYINEEKMQLNNNNNNNNNNNILYFSNNLIKKTDECFFSIFDEIKQDIEKKQKIEKEKKQKQKMHSKILFDENNKEHFLNTINDNLFLHNEINIKNIYMENRFKDIFENESYENDLDEDILTNIENDTNTNYEINYLENEYFNNIQSNNLSTQENTLKSNKSFISFNIITNMDEAKLKIDNLLQSFFKKQIYLYVFRDQFLKKYNKVINPLYFGYNSLIEFIFFACKDICKIYILNNNLILIHNSYIPCKEDEDNYIEFCYSDYYNEEKENSNFKNTSLELYYIFKNISNRRKNFFITYFYWKKFYKSKKSNYQYFNFLDNFNEQYKKKKFYSHFHNQNYFDLKHLYIYGESNYGILNMKKKN